MRPFNQTKCNPEGTLIWSVEDTFLILGLIFEMQSAHIMHTQNFKPLSSCSDVYRPLYSTLFLQRVLTNCYLVCAYLFVSVENSVGCRDVLVFI